MSGPRTEEWDRDVLSRQIHDKTWAGEYWGAGGVIVLTEDRFRKSLHDSLGEPEKEAAAYSSISSTYYSAAGNAYARFQRASLWTKPLWAIRAVRYLRKALEASDKVQALLGLLGMTPDQLDIRSTILRSVGRWDEALRCLEEALARPNLRPESRVLLLMGKAECLDREKKHPEAEDILHEASEICLAVRVQTQVRFHKAFGEHFERRRMLENARHEYETALWIARETGGLGDQEQKILARLERLPK